MWHSGWVQLTSDRLLVLGIIPASAAVKLHWKPSAFSGAMNRFLADHTGPGVAWDSSNLLPRHRVKSWVLPGLAWPRWRRVCWCWPPLRRQLTISLMLLTLGRKTPYAVSLQCWRPMAYRKRIFCLQSPAKAPCLPFPHSRSYFQCRQFFSSQKKI